MANYWRQRYPVSLRVSVDFADGYAPLVDAIKGLNAGHALWRARQNWPDAVAITDLGPEPDTYAHERS